MISGAHSVAAAPMGGASLRSPRRTPERARAANDARAAEGADGSTKLYRRVAVAIIEAIEAGEYGLGDRLPGERELAERFGVSRPTVREAMIVLETLGIATTRRGTGIVVTEAAPARVASFPADLDIIDRIEACRLFEGEIAALAAKMAQAQQCAELEGLLEGFGAGRDALETCRRVHLLVARITANATMIATVERLWSSIGLGGLAADILDPGRNDVFGASRDEIAAVITALRRGDPGAARQAMRDHLGQVLERLLARAEKAAIDEIAKDGETIRQAAARRLAV